MAIDTFPTLSELKRPAALLQAVVGNDSGIILVSGDTDSGVTTTVTALAHEMQGMGRNPLYLCVNESDAIPGIDSISIDTVDNALIHYLMEEGRPDSVIFKDTFDSGITYLASRLAEAGSLVVGGVRALSAEDAVEKFLRSIAERNISSGGERYLIRLSMFQKFFYESYSAKNKEIIEEFFACHRARMFFAQEEVNRYKYASGPQFPMFYQVVTKLF